MQTSERTPTNDLTEHHLELFGYSVTWFRDGRGCVVWDETEHWVGEGADRSEALRASVALMLPSRAARHAVAAVVALRSMEGAATRPEPTPAPSAVPPLALPLAEPLPVAEDAAPVEIDAPCAAPERTTVTPPPSSPALPGRDVNDVQAAIEALDAIENAVTAAEPDLAMMAPELQRLQMVAWVTRARAVAEQFTEVDRVVRRVRRLSARVAGLSKSWWPGAIGALRPGAAPAQSLRGLVTSDELSAACPQTWGDAADAVEPVLAARLTRVPFDGGWSDLRTPNVEGAAADADVERAARDVDAALATKDASDEQLSMFVDAARRLRSVRRSVTNTRAWAEVVGKLREYASRAPGRCAELLRVLDPATVPTESWAHELRHERRPEVEAALRDARSPELLARALVAAFDVLDTPALAKVLADRADEVNRVTDQMVGDDRRVRRRLVQLKRALGRSAGPTVNAIPSGPARPVLLDGPSPLRRALRERLAGKSVLFVGNREDPELKEALMLAFGFVVTWCVPGPRRLDAAREKVAGGGYDLVLAATAFIGHSADRALAPAARAAGVPYVRVDHGRVAACELALAREFGLGQAKAA